ncbi:FecR family protein [Sphingobacterium sp. SYP-B4668]|uniref:FecR family protein n=1 Tax=Sphingobacterium sp. SYP-B4668 TaxID=2996035 RepID=UPI0022DE9492|nr:FecR family protein [Sphingobacterium sp. SYP-B4668]
MTSNEEITFLIKRKLEGNITPAENDYLLSWAKKSPHRTLFLERVLREDLLWEDVCIWLELELSDQQDWSNRLEDTVLEKIHQHKQGDRQSSLGLYRRLMPYGAAAVLIVLFGIGIYQYRESRFMEGDALTTVIDIEAGEDKASLTLTDGRIVELNGTKAGIVVDNQLTYADGAPIPTGQLQGTDLVTLSVPRGGKYKITLSDGTEVWLNAASKLRYPIRFTRTSRTVELEGEAYFDVAKAKGPNGHIPFLVKSARQTVQVLGTQFNLKAYGDEASSTTTLVEGSVLLRTPQDSMKLRPGEQGIYRGNVFRKANVNVEEFTAWKDNKFIFNETTLPDAMAQISRWYDIEIVYKGASKQTYFYGEISRTKKLSEVLAILKEGGVSFKIERKANQNRLIVLL